MTRRQQKRAEKKHIKSLKPKPKRALKRFGFWYYPAQFFIVHLLLFGLVLEPSLLDMWSAFRITSILSAFWSVVDLIIIAWQIGNYMALVILAIWFALRVAWASRMIILYAFVLIQLVMYIIRSFKCWINSNQVNTNRQVTVRNGAPGDGKTRFSVYYCLILSQIMWGRLRWLHYTYQGKLEKWQREGNTTKLRDWQEIKDSYEYYMTPQLVNGKWYLPAPCLFSNIGIIICGQYVSRLTKAHLMQHERLPSYTIIMGDEIGTILDVDDYKNKPLVVSDFLRWIRQFVEVVFIGTEQDSTNIYIDCRRVITENEYMQGCTQQMKPLPLVGIHKLLKLILLKTDRGQKFFAPVMGLLESLINSVGFVRFKYRSEGNTEHANGLQRDTSFTIRAWQPFQYDTRAFRFLYNMRDEPISGKVHTCLHVENTPQNRIDFLRSETPPPTEYDLDTEFMKDAKRLRDFNKLAKDCPTLYQEYCNTKEKPIDPAEQHPHMDGGGSD